MSRLEAPPELAAPEQARRRHVCPPDWKNPTPRARYDLVVLGGGTAGLVTAVAAASLGAQVALAEAHALGGDCLNVGCVPSKTLIAAARRAAEVRDAARFGVRLPGEPSVDFPAVMQRMRALRARIAEHDSAERLRSLGIDVFFGRGRFTSGREIAVGGQTLRFKRAVIATGARPAALPIPGLEAAGYRDNTTVFDLTELPARIAVIGAGPIGCELAQSFARFGAEVTLIEIAERILIREDPDAAAIVQRALERDGVRLRLGVRTRRVERSGTQRRIEIEGPDGTETVIADEIVLGVGRRPNVDGLGLEAAGVAFDPRTGVLVDERLRTSARRIFAAGDVCSRHAFTHTADAMARIVVRNALFLGRASTTRLVIPWATYTDPEIAHVGLYPKDAEQRGIAIDTFTVPFEQLDRAVLEGRTDGLCKIHVRRGTDRIVGATLVGPGAGDWISEITTCMVGGVGLARLSSVIHPYPSYAEALRKAADSYQRSRLTPRLARWIRRWLRLLR